MAEGLVNYTRLDDSPERIINTQGKTHVSGRRSVGGGCRRESTAAGRVLGRLMTRGPYTFRGYFNSPQHNASAFDANGFY